MYNCTFPELLTNTTLDENTTLATTPAPTPMIYRLRHLTELYIYIYRSSFNRIRIRTGNKVKNPIRIKIKMVWIRNTLINNIKKIRSSYLVHNNHLCRWIPTLLLCLWRRGPRVPSRKTDHRRPSC
jgi:hypothetical protein